MMELSGNKRIVLNIAATYGRSLFSIVCALLTAGWVFIALGEVDFGLYGVVGGLTAFVSFFNGILSGAVGRFYAYSVGEAQRDPEIGIENCRKWFNTAITIHTAVPCLLIVIGYPIGAYAVRHWLTIPVDRVEACIWIWRFACVSCFAGMISVPFNAMYSAKQYIAELTLYSFGTTLLNLLFVIYMHYHPGDWFVPYALWQCFLAILPQAIISLRAYMIFPECKFVREYMFIGKHLRQIFSFSAYQGMGCFCGLLQSHGISVLTNIYFGPAMNAAMSISSSIESNTRTLSSSMMGAFAPAITNACGAGNDTVMRKMAFQLNKIGTLAMLIFALPIMLELPEILQLWLKNPPRYTYGLCLIAVAAGLVNMVSVGQMTAVNASGKIRAYHICLSLISIFSLPLAWLWVARGGNVYGMQGILLFMIGLNTLGRVYFAKIHVGMSARYWFVKVLIPLILVTVASGMIGYLPHLFMREGMIRILITLLMTELSFLPLAWLILLDQAEREFVIRQIRKIKEKFTGGRK